MKKYLMMMLVVCGVAWSQPSPTPLPNGWLGGYTLPPSSCSSGISPSYYYIPAATLYHCEGNQYVVNAILTICAANTYNGTSYGCNVASPQAPSGVPIPTGTPL